MDGCTACRRCTFETECPIRDWIAGVLADFGRAEASQVLGFAFGSNSPRQKLIEEYRVPVPPPRPPTPARVATPTRPSAPPERPEDVDAALALLQAQGYQLVRHAAPDHSTVHKVKVKPVSSDTFRVGIVADMHLGSRYQQLTHLKTAYATFAAENIDTVLNLGDLAAGSHMHPDQEYENFLHGGDQQVDYIVAHYPLHEQITTFIVGGNHDYSHVKRNGQDLPKAVCGQREDMTYLGMFGATVEISGVRIYLAHPDGGGAYARSYKMQKTIEGFSPQEKPHIYLSGHFHSNCALPMYRNVYGLMVGCFEAQTPYLKRKGLYPELGAHILTVGFDTAGVVSITDQHIPFFSPVENDY